MKETLNQLFLDSIEIHAPTFDCDFDSGTDSPYPIHHNVPSGPDP